MPLAQPAQINTLPPEILSSIFVTVVDASIYACSTGDDSYGTSEYPTLISSVCTYWRRVALGTPYLWSHIDLMPSNCEHNAEHAKLWLERSQSSPLRVRLRKTGEHVGESDVDYLEAPHKSPRHISDQLASILFLSAPRLHSLTLNFTYFYFAAGMLLALLPKQPPIRELVLRQNKFMGGRLAGLSQTEWDRLLEPLRVLYFDRVNIRSYKVSCRNLVELYLISPSNFSTGRFAQILESNPGLRTIVLSQPVFDIRRARPTAPINLPSVRYVQLPSCQRAIRRLFEFLVPGPHALDLHLGAITDPADFTNTMIPFFQRANVKSLYLHGYKIYLLPILTALPHLQILGLSKFKFDASTFAGLESAVNLLPKLHTINLNECNFDDYSELCPGLRVLLSLPSVRQIKHLNCRYRQKDSVWKDGIQPSEGSGFNATIIQASVSDFETHASPFR